MSCNEYRPACGWLNHYRKKQIVERIRTAMAVLFLLLVFASAPTLIYHIEGGL